MTGWAHINTSGRKIGYARVSTKDQKLRMQRDALNAVACDEIYADHGVSGAQSNRPALGRMLKALKPGDTVVVFKLDRLGRSVLHLSDMLVWFRENGIEFASLAEGINTTTPGGKLVYHLFAAFAEFQRDIIIENTLHGIEAAKQRGKTLGRPRVLNIEQVSIAHGHMKQKGMTCNEMAKCLGVSRMTLHRAIKRFELEKAT